MSLITQRDESGDSRLEACVVIHGHFVVDVILAVVHVVVVLIWTAYQSTGEYVVVRFRAVKIVPITCGRLRWARTEKLFIPSDPALIEGLSWILDALFAIFRSVLSAVFLR